MTSARAPDPVGGFRALAALALIACGSAAADGKCKDVICQASDACHVAGVCEPSTGVCSNPAAPEDTACDADSNGCTRNDLCKAGVCTAGHPVVCNTPPRGGCYAPIGVCHSTGDNTFGCSYTAKPAGSRCPSGADKCLQTWICDGKGTCEGSAPKTCAGADQCQGGGTCNPADGSCSNVPLADGTRCNADSNGCTRGDSCQSGVCTPGALVACDSPPGQCWAEQGTCASTGDDSFDCLYGKKPPGAACNDGNRCTRSDACDGQGACVGSDPVDCAASACATGGTCNPSSGACQGGTNQPNGTPCTGPDACNTYACASGVCTGTSRCGLDQSCDPAVPICKDSAPTPLIATRIQLVAANGLAQDKASAVYLAGGLAPPTIQFDPNDPTRTLTSNGIVDAAVVKYDAAGNAIWGRSFGDAADQEVGGVAVTDPASNRVAVIGTFLGQIGALNAGTSLWSYLFALDATTGNAAWSRAFDLGLGGALLAVAANPQLGLIAVCGKADKLARDTTAGAPGVTWATVAGANTAGALTDIVVGLYDKDGAKLWAKQIGTGADEQCSALAVDDVGDVIAAGNYSGNGNLILAGPAALPNPGSSFRRHLWVAKFDGTTGAGRLQKSFGSSNGQHTVAAAAVDADGNLALAGSFTNTIPFGAFTPGTACNAANDNGCLQSAGGQEAFVARLDPTLLPTWVTRIGSQADDIARTVAFDSFGNITAAGFLNGAATWCNITPATLATAPAPALTPPGNLTAAFVTKLRASSGNFSASTSSIWGNTTKTTAARALVVNRWGTGAARDQLAIAGEFGDELTIGSLPPLSASRTSEVWVAFGGLQ